MPQVFRDSVVGLGLQVDLDSVVGRALVALADGLEFLERRVFLDLVAGLAFLDSADFLEH